MKPQSDTDLARLAAAGDRSAFELLLVRHYDMMFRIAVKWSGSPEDGQDIAQNACIKLARVIGKFEGRAAFSTWLCRLVINVARDWHRSEKRHKHGHCELDDSLLPPGTDTPESRAEARQVLEAIHRLPDAEKAALLLVHSEGMSHAEAAIICKCKEGTISWRIHEARKKLKEMQSNGVPA